MNTILLLDGATTVDFSGYITALQSSITVSEVLAILTSIVGVGVAFVLMWMGVRKLTAAFVTAVTTGRFRV